MEKKQLELTVRQAADLLGKSPESVRHHIRKGHLPFLRKISTMYFLDPDVVRRFKPNPVGHPCNSENTSEAINIKHTTTSDTIRAKRKK